jgi:hypothetical protein
MTGTRHLARYLPATVGALLLLSTALLVLGVVLEHRSDSTAPHTTTSEPAGHQDEAAPAEGGADEDAAEAREDGEDGEASAHAESQDETVVGVRTESPAVVTAGAFASVLLAGLIWRRPTRKIAAAVVLFGAAAAVADALEVSHQATENSGGLAVLAAVVAAGHVAVAVIAAILWQRAAVQRPQLQPATD